MKTPIVDFVTGYADDKDMVRLHMPGHKGVSLTGFENYDITEISGADSLYEAGGIIRESENNASEIFDAGTFYSTEGSSLCIRAMLYLALLHVKKSDVIKRAWVLAGRNAHRTFLSAAALLDLDVKWLYPKEEESYLSCKVTAEDIESVLAEAQHKPVAVYITSPDYLGNRVDIASIVQVCHKHGVLLLVDNAHGAYLKFLPKSEHPMDLGADMCCDSAHKTLPALTGAAYLHIGKHLPESYSAQAKHALSLFGSTSPSYLILQSLDALNCYLSGQVCEDESSAEVPFDEGYESRLAKFIHKLEMIKKRLIEAGYTLLGDEPLKITMDAKKYGYTGYELADILRKQKLVCEFADPDYLVLMLTPEISDKDLEKLKNTLMEIVPREPIKDKAPKFQKQEQVLSVRDAMFSKSEQIPVEESEGRILSIAAIGCPPAVPIVICGERIDKHAIECLRYYGFQDCWVVQE